MHCLLIMLLIFESQVSIPYWLQPLGRMHPLALHFPIAFIILLVILNLFKKQIESNSFKKINRFLILFTAFTTVLTTIMGLFLSMEGDTTNLMTIHKWGGVILSFLIYALTLIKKETIFKIVLYTAFISVILVGHYGAGLTHGTNFITEPLKKEAIVKINEQTPIYKGFIKPILDAKCVSCHNSEKQKGDLDMSSFNTIMSGGKHGSLWVSGNPDKSALLKRVHLPLDHKEHMPPQGKKQLTKKEIKLLNTWIKQGADEKISLAQLSENDSLGLIISKRIEEKKQQKKPTYAFNFANKKDINALENPYRTVIQKSPTSPAIDVVIHGRQTYKPEFLTDLSKINQQIVSLNLSFLPIDRNAIKFISTFTNLEELILNFTNLKTEDLEDLKACVNLQTLALSGTQISANIDNILRQLPKINNVFLWNTTIPEDKIEALKKQFTHINFETGFQDFEEELTLTPPQLLSKNTVISKNDYVKLGHKMPGVEIRYTTDGTKPDKSSQLYKTPIKVDLKSNHPIKTIAYKNNWLPSQVKSYSFFDKGYLPENLELVYPGLNSEFIGEAKMILTDHNIGNSNDIKSSPYWATFNNEKPLNAIAYFGETPPNIKQIVFSYGMNYWQQKEPLATLEIWGSQNKNDFTLIKRIKKTHKKVEKVRSGKTKKLVIETHKYNYKYYKIIAIPQNKEELFIDQLFFY